MMTALELIKKQLQGARELFESTVGDVQSDHLHKDPGGKAFPLAGTYAHLIFSEDMIVHQLIQGKTPLFASDWKDKTGASAPMPPFDDQWESAHHQWSKTVQVDIEKLREYSKAVYQATDTYVESLKDEDLSKEINLGAWGKKTIADMLTNFIIQHTCSLAGEISVLKGIQGVKGYPF